MYRSIVIGTDGSETAGEAVRQAIELAKSVGAALHVVGAYQPVPEQQLRQQRQGAPADVQWSINPHQEVDKNLNDARTKVEQAGVKVEVHSREGDPADAILDVADDVNADLIVVGNRGMTGARRFLLGSVPNKISHHARCSVMIIRTT
jgi:nucleotide-binding universal stress UspA family protein